MSAAMHAVVQRLMSVFPREGLLLFLVALGVLIPGWVKGINLLLLLGFVLMALWLVNLLAAGRQVRRLRGRRNWLEPIFAGAESHWEVEVQNSRAMPSSWFRVLDEGPDHRQEWFVSRIEGERTVRLRSAVVLPRRGQFNLEPLRAECLYPFGLARRVQRLAGSDECIVLPRLGRLKMARFQRWLAKMTRGDGRLHRLARPSMIHQDDLHGLRPFRPGDNPRWIHWRTSARRNLKMVREFEEDAGQNLVLILDPWSPQGMAEAAALEAAISLAATIAWEWCRHSTDYLMLAVAGAEPFVRGGYASRDNALALLRRLAVVRGEQSVAAAPLVKAASAIVVPEAPVLVVSSRGDSPLFKQLSAAWKRPTGLVTIETAAEFYDAPPPAAEPAVND